MKKLFAVLLIAACPAFAALNAATVFELRVGGSDTNGGGFQTGATGTDYSLALTPQYSVTDAVTNGTTTITSATAAFGVTDMPGNICYVQGGTGAVVAGWYQIASRTNATTIVVDRTTGLTAGTGVTLHCGGALKSPGLASSLMTVTGMVAFLRQEGSVFSATSATPNIIAGVISNSSSVYFIGYTTNRFFFNTDTQPTFQLNVASATAATGSAGLAIFNNIIFDGNSQTASVPTSGGMYIGVGFKNFTNASATTAGIFIGCSSTTNGGTVFAGSSYFSEAYANTATGFSASAFRCLSYGNTGATTHGFINGTVLIGNTAYGNGQDGFNEQGGSPATMINNYSEANTRYGFAYANSVKMAINNAAYNNTTANVNSTVPGVGLVTSGFLTLTASALVNPGSSIFTINSTTGGGAALRSAAYPALLPRGLTANFEAIGAANPAATGGQVGYAIQ